MLRRLFTLVILLGILAVALYYWNQRRNEGRREAGEIGSRLREDLSSVPQRLSDAKVTASVKTAFELNRDLGRFSINVDTTDGVVTLRGEVSSAEMKELADRTAGAVKDVRQVTNELRVNPSLPAGGAERTLGEKVDDEALEAKVKLAFSLNRNLEGSDLKVRSFRREVTLSGEVAHRDQRELARRLAEQVSGVASVRDEVRLHGEVPSGGAQPAPASAADVERAVRASSSLAAYDLHVREEGGRLVLRGRVRTAAEKELAAALAREAAGRPVENAVEIQP